MPEGPEVLRCGNQLRTTIKGQTLLELKPISGKLSRQISAIAFNSTITDVIVKGKTIFIQLDNGQEIVSTLGMSGWWYPPLSLIDKDLKVYQQGKLVPAIDIVLKTMKHTRVELVTSGNSAFYVDPRNFGNLKVVDSTEADKIRAALGLSLLTPDLPVSGGEAISRLRQFPNREIGEILLDQKILCGLGNIYRAETLYISRINPFRMIKDLSYEELARIITVAIHVLNISYYYEGTLVYPCAFLEEHMNVKLDEDHDSIRGPLVYGRRKDSFANPVNSSKLASRTLWWVPNIQK